MPDVSTATGDADRHATASRGGRRGSDTEGTIDGRTTRWEAHRAERRSALVSATLRAIREHGASVGMDDIAAMAGTSKTVFYRHFDDRAGLYRAVAEQVDAGLIARVSRTATPSRDDANADAPLGNGAARELLRASVDTYLRLVEDDPEVYRFVVTAPIVPAREGDGLAEDVTNAMSGRMVSLLSGNLEASGLAPDRAQRWGRAVVGLVRAAGDDWLRAGASGSGTSRSAIVDDVTALLWEGLSSVWES